MKLQFLSLVAGRALSGLILTLMTVLVARNSDPSSFGQAALVLSTGMFLFVVFDFGLSTYIARAEARGDQADVHGALRANAWSTAAGVVVSAVLLAILSSATGSGWLLGLVGLALSLGIDKSADAISSVAIARTHKISTSLMLLLRRGVALIALLGLVHGGFDWLSAFVLSLPLGSAVAFAYIRWMLRSAYRTQNTTSMRRVLSAAFPFLLSNASASVRNLDVSIVSVLGTPAAAGIYSAAQRLTSPFLLLPNTLGTLILPAASRGGWDRARSIARKLVVLHLAFLLLCGMVALFSEQIVLVTLGAAYSAASPVVLVCLLAFPFTALASPLGGVLQSQGEERFVGTNGVAFSLVFIAAVAVGFMSLDATGAMLGVLVTYLLKCTFLMFRIERASR